MLKKQAIYLVREDRVMTPCWQIKNCPAEQREKCIVWQYQAGYYCWYINGTFCQGRVHETWGEKMELCEECEVFKPMKVKQSKN
jgi:hypothetical protein